MPKMLLISEKDDDHIHFMTHHFRFHDFFFVIVNRAIDQITQIKLIRFITKLILIFSNSISA